MITTWPSYKGINPNILFTVPTIKDSHVIFCNTFVKIPERKKDKICTFFELKCLIYLEKLSPYSLFVCCASDNLVHILLQ